MSDAIISYQCDKVEKPAWCIFMERISLRHIQNNQTQLWSFDYYVFFFFLTGDLKLFEIQSIFWTELEFLDYENNLVDRRV